jgi:hypothetical protein
MSRPSILFTFLISWILLIVPTAAQPTNDALPLTGEEVVIKNNTLFFAATPTSLRGNILNIFAAQGKNHIYHFTPYVSLSWDMLKVSIDRACSDSTTAVHNIKLDISLYSPSLIEELRATISQKSDTLMSKISIAPIQNVGVLVVAFDHDDKPYEILNTVPIASLLKGAPLTPTGGVQGHQVGRLQGICSELRQVHDRQKIDALMYVVGATAKVSQLTAMGTSLLRSTLISDLKESQSQVDRRIVKAKKKGAGIAVKLGPISLGANENNAETSTNREHYRIINRTWLESSFERASTEIDVDQVCDGPCPSETFDKTFSHFFGALAAQQVSLDTTRSDMWIAKYKGVNMPVQTLTANEDVKAVLNAALTSEDKKEGSYQGVQFKKEDNVIWIANSDVGWTKKGEEWVPTTMNAYVVNVADLEKRLQVSQRQMILGETANAAIKLPTFLSPPPVMPFGDDRVGNLRRELQAILKDPNLLTKFNSRKLNQPAGRVPNVLYQNERDYPIGISVLIHAVGVVPLQMCSAALLVNDIQISSISSNLSEQACLVSGVIPPRGTYKVLLLGGALVTWGEYF